jgi:tetratricopeptide (TPR) repeat protein
VGFVVTQTIVMLSRTGTPPAELVKIDIGALAEIVDHLAWALEKQGKTEAILHTFEHLIRTVPLPGLEERLAYLKCIWLRHKLNKPEEADKIIAQWPSYKEIQDICLLQMYFEIHAPSLSRSECLEILTWIIGRSESPTEKLYYSHSKATFLVMIGDEEEARRFHQRAMGQLLNATAAEAEKGESFACEVCARVLEFQWFYEKDEAAFQRSLSFYNRIDVGQFVPKGASIILYEKGSLLLLKGEVEQAIKCFTEALERHPGVLPRMYRMEAYSRAKKLKEARQDYDVLSTSAIPEDYLLEFCSCAAILANQAGDLELARLLLARAKSLKLRVMYFSHQRDQLCIELMEFIGKGRSEPRKATVQGKITSILEKIRRMSDYFELKPNIAGVGLNLNRVLRPKANEDDPRGGE